MFNLLMLVAVGGASASLVGQAIIFILFNVPLINAGGSWGTLS